jgi:hypothetical protein
MRAVFAASTWTLAGSAGEAPSARLASPQHRLLRHNVPCVVKSTPVVVTVGGVVAIGLSRDIPAQAEREPVSDAKTMTFDS